MLRGYLGVYRERLAAGRAIGSGLIERVYKNLAGYRLKQARTQWKVLRLNRMAAICSVLYSGQWKYCRKYSR